MLGSCFGFKAATTAKRGNIDRMKKQDSTAAFSRLFYQILYDTPTISAGDNPLLVTP